MTGTYLQVMARQWKLIMSVVIVAVVLSLVLSLLQKPMYRTSAELLIVPKNYTLTDVYNSSNSIGHLATTFSEVVYSNSFMDSTLASGLGVEDNFGSTPLKRKENWKKAIDTKVVNETGFLQINVYQPSKQQSSFLAYAIINVLSNKANEYFGQTDSVLVRVVDSPVTSDRVAKPDVLQNFVLGGILGLLAGLGLAFAFPEERDINIFDAIKNLRQRRGGQPVEEVFPAAPSESAVSEMPELIPTGNPEPVAEVPVDLPDGTPPVADPVKIAVAENEPVELTHEERSEHWLKTGEVK